MASADHWLSLIAVIAAAAALQWLLRRTLRHLQRSARRSRPRGGPLSQSSTLVRLVAATQTLASVVLWSAVAFYASEDFELLHAARTAVVSVVRMSLMTPLLQVDGASLSIADLLFIPLVLGVLWLFVSVLMMLLRTGILQPSGLAPGMQETIVLLVRHSLMLVGTIIVLQASGIDVRNLAILASVLGVGIGFGLQNLANNFVSGLALNLERPIQPGDFVQIGELSGTVERVGARCTEIRTLDRVTILVPNSKLLENEVVNWSHGDTVARLHLRVPVAYGTDLRALRSLLLGVAGSHREVLRDPRPQVELHGFGDSSLDCELLVWTDEPRSQNRLKSDLYYRIDAALRQHHITIPFPQRDLHIHTAAPALAPQPINGSLHPHTDGEGSASSAWLEVDDDRGPRSWSEEHMAACIARMRAPQGLSMRDRRHLLSTYARCFVGREAVDWLMNNENLTRNEAIELGELLIERGVIHHVLDEHGFKDAALFYRFYADEPN